MAHLVYIPVPLIDASDPACSMVKYGVDCPGLHAELGLARCGSTTEIVEPEVFADVVTA